MHLGLAEWITLSVIDERPMHGFAVAALTARDGELGRIWHIPRPVVYRALGRLLEAELVRPDAVESDAGPQRTVYAATALGRRQAEAWLSSPVLHVRDMRSHFLLKLALLHRRDADRAPLLARQIERLTTIATALDQDEPEQAGFDAVLFGWRRATTMAAIEFVGDLARTTPRRGRRHPVEAPPAGRLSSGR
jgi:DNA-binding PadR family transcriptional regulator